MWTKNERRGMKLFFGVMTLFLLAGCASSPQATEIETALTEKATPDPLALQCIHESGKNDFCYAGNLLAENTSLLEKATRDFCLHSDGFFCFIYIWKDEESVAQSYPLTDAESSSMIAKFTSNPQTGRECFQAYSKGEVVYSSDDCD